MGAGLDGVEILPQGAIIRSVSQQNYKCLHFMACLRNCFAWNTVVETADVLCTVFSLAVYSEWHQLEITLE